MWTGYWKSWNHFSGTTDGIDRVALGMVQPDDALPGPQQLLGALSLLDYLPHTMAY